MDNYESNIPKAKKNINKSVDKGFKKASEFIIKEIQNNLLRQNAKDTGTLIKSYTAEITDDGFEVGSDKDYSAYVEFGTGVYAEDGKGVKSPWAFKNSNGEWRMTNGMRPRPHVRPAFEDNADEIERILAEELEDIE